MATASMITREELELAISETESLISTMIMKKYAEGDEKTLADVIERIVRLIEERYNRSAYTSEEIEHIKTMLRKGYFIPGGSILAGLSQDRKKKSSLSNCYVLKIKNDSIESIFTLLGEMAKTYSYRGGCGADITTLRPHGIAVNNAAKTSSGAVSFMPMIANVTETIGQDEGRRGAMMITLDVRHPDIMRFIWSKADPERVFYTDNMNKTLTSKKIIALLNTCQATTPILEEIKNICNTGKTATIDSANISIRYSTEFMNAVTHDLEWCCYFPDIHADKEKYDKEWDGDYDKWTQHGGILKEYRSYRATVTKDNCHRFVDQEMITKTELAKKCTMELLLELIQGGPVEMTFKLPSARQIFRDACIAAWLRGDPGALFWDQVTKWSTITDLHESLKLISTNPCSEIPSYAGGSCLLGAHVLSKYVVDPWGEKPQWDADTWHQYVISATQLMNIFSDINEEMHPLDEQIEMEKFAKRIGIEFTGLGDALAMLGYTYGNCVDTISFVRKIMCQKSYLEIQTSARIAFTIGCCPVFDSETNPEARTTFINSEYFTHLCDCVNALESQFSSVSDLPKSGDWRFHSVKVLRETIQKYGLRNVGFNTVGPTGSLSILMDNCSSGIEPIFALICDRTTRVGSQKVYRICHAPLARHLLTQQPGPHTQNWDIHLIKKVYNIVEAHELNYQDRIAIQAAVQEFCDSSISSTLNLPNDCTVDDIMQIYQYAWKEKLKGVTIFRNGSLDGVLDLINHSGSEPTPRASQLPVAVLARGTLIEPSKDANSRSHRITWNGYHMYITITLDDNQQPAELFISNLPREVSVENEVFDPFDYQEKMSLWMAITRLVSIGLRGGIPVTHFVKQLNKASFIVNDLMSIVARILSLYVGDPKIKELAKDMSIENLAIADFTTICPSCKQKTYIHQGGCGQCMNPDCGYAKC